MLLFIGAQHGIHGEEKYSIYLVLMLYIANYVCVLLTRRISKWRP